MSRPRKPFGVDLPGRLPATMLKVLAAELSDPARHTRGKRYWADDAVVDIMIGHGAVTAEVQGSRREPYVVTIEADPGPGAPSSREVRVWCSCPDDDGTGRAACKHAVAALLAVADEVAVDPDVLRRWRRTDDVVGAPPEQVDTADGVRRDHPGTAPRSAPSRATDEHVAIAPLLLPPSGRALPPLPELSPRTAPRLADPLVDEVLADALDHLAIRWD